MQRLLVISMASVQVSTGEIAVQIGLGEQKVEIAHPHRNVRSSVIRM